LPHARGGVTRGQPLALCQAQQKPLLSLLRWLPAQGSVEQG